MVFVKAYTQPQDPNKQTLEQIIKTLSNTICAVLKRVALRLSPCTINWVERTSRTHTLLFRSLRSVRFLFWKKFKLLFCMNALNWLKMTVRTFITLQKISILNKCCSFELSFQRGSAQITLHNIEKDKKRRAQMQKPLSAVWNFPPKLAFLLSLLCLCSIISL